MSQPLATTDSADIQADFGPARGDASQIMAMWSSLKQVRRVRIPKTLLYSRQHSASAFVFYGRARLLGERCWAKRETLAALTGMSVRTVDRAIHQLTYPQSAGGSGFTHPAYMRSHRRGPGQTSVRDLMPGVPYVEMPAYAYGHADRPITTDPTLLRLLAVYQDKKLGRGYCHLSSREIGALAGVRPQSVSGMNRRLAALGLIVVVSRPRRADAVLPLNARLDPADPVAAQCRADIEWALETACGYLDDLPDDGSFPVSSGGGSAVSSGGNSGVSSSGGSPIDLDLALREIFPEERVSAVPGSCAGAPVPAQRPNPAPTKQPETFRPPAGVPQVPAFVPGPAWAAAGSCTALAGGSETEEEEAPKALPGAFRAAFERAHGVSWESWRAGVRL